MADGYALALLRGLRATLAANSGLTALVGARIYDEPPASAAFPYLRFTAIDPTAFDTDGTEGAEVQIGMEANSALTGGRVEAVRIVEAVKDALHRNEGDVMVAGFNLIELIFQTYTAARDPDRDRYVATISLRATVEKPKPAP